jgi:hypothetical protein
MTFTEVIIKDKVKIVLKLIVPEFYDMEHGITDIDGNEVWGYLNKPLCTADIYYHDKFAFTLVKKQFTDHIMINIDSELAKLKFKAVYHLRNKFNVSDENSLIMQKRNLSYFGYPQPV